MFSNEVLSCKLSVSTEEGLTCSLLDLDPVLICELEVLLCDLEFYVALRPEP